MTRPAPAGRPRVWVVTPALHCEGATERAVAEQVVRWRERYQLTVYTMETRGVDLTGVTVRRIPRLPGPHLLRYVWWLAAVAVARRWDAWRTGPPDVLHSPGVNGLAADAIGVHIVFASHWARVRDRVLRDLVHGPGRWRAAHRVLYWQLVRRLERAAYRRAATLWALSQADATALERLRGGPRGSVPVVRYGVDAAAFSVARRDAARAEARKALEVGDRRVALLVGNDWHKKGLDRALAALARLASDWMLLAVGGDDPSAFRRRAAALGVADRVRFEGFRRDVRPYLAAADCLLAPSREDAFHMPALEAMASGLPVVLAAEAGAAEVLGQAAVVVHDADDAEALAAATLEAATVTPVMRERCARGAALAGQMTWDAYADATAALVDEERTRPRVLLLVADAWGTGGIETLTRDMIHAAARRFGPGRVGVVSLWGPSSNARDLPCVMLDPGAHRPDPARRRVSLRARLRFAASAVRAAWRWRGARLTIVAAHAHVAPVAQLAAWLAGASFAVWGYGVEVWGHVRPLMSFALRRARAVFAISNFTAERLRPRTAPGALAIVPPGCSRLRDEPPSRSSGGHVVLSVARLDRLHAYKGVDAMLRAWPHVLDAIPDAELHVVGAGDDQGRLEGIARSLRLDGRVRFRGVLDDRALDGAYGAADVFALPGRARLEPSPEGEGFGLVFLEAAAAGLPVVAGNAGGASEAVEDGVTGLLVDPESPNAIAAAVVRLLDDPTLARRMGQAGRERVARHFSAQRFEREFGDHLLRLAGLDG